MVTFGDLGKKPTQAYSIFNSDRIHKRVSLRTSLFVRRLFNSPDYKRKVETVDISAQGLKVICDVKLEVGAELEIFNSRGNVKAIAVVKHTSKDLATGKWLLGLAITEKKTGWFVTEDLDAALVKTRMFSFTGQAVCQ